MSVYAIKGLKNVWQIEVIRGYNPKGKKIRYYERFKGGKKEAVTRESEIKAEVNKGIFVPRSDLTFGDYLDKWLEEYAVPNLQPMTVYGYKKMIADIKIELGFYKLTDINTLTLTQFYNKLKLKPKYEKECKYHKNKTGETISLNTVGHYYALINRALEIAVKWDMIFMNPNSRIDKPKPMKKEAKCYDLEQTKKLLESLENEPSKCKAIILLALDTSARRGELTGLDWNDVFLDNETPYVVINKTTQYVNGQIIEKDPKNQSSIRRVYITSITAKALSEYKETQEELKSLYGSKWGNSNKVFTTDDGYLMHPDTPRKTLKRIIKKYDLEKLNFHGLRHTSISLQIESGIQTQIISKRAGHSNITTTHMIYSHIFDSASTKVAETMNSIFTT